MEKRIEISENVKDVLTETTYNQLMSDLEQVKQINANDKEVVGKTKHGFNFRKLFNSIIVF